MKKKHLLLGALLAASAVSLASCDLSLTPKYEANSTTTVVTTTPKATSTKPVATTTPQKTTTPQSTSKSSTTPTATSTSSVTPTTSTTSGGGSVTPTTSTTDGGSSTPTTTPTPTPTQTAPVVQKYSISFNANGQNVDVPTAITDVTEIPSTLASLNNLDNYDFVGWGLEATSTTPVTAGTALTGDITLYAIWNRTKFNISYDANGKNANIPNDTINVNQIPSDLPELQDIPGFNFVGWGLTADATTPVTAGTAITEDITLYAIWEIGTYSISFNANGKNVDIPNNVVNVSEIPANLPSLSNDGYFEFVGWGLTADATTPVTAGTTITENTTLYAIWEEKGIDIFSLSTMVSEITEPYEFSDTLTSPTSKDFMLPNLITYKKLEGTTDESNLSVTVNNTTGKMLVHDANSLATTYGYLIPGIKFTSGKIVINTTLKLNAIGGKWSFLHICGTNTAVTSVSSIFAIGLEGSSNRYFSYALNGVNDTLDNTNAAYVNPDSLGSKVKPSANTDYNIVITIDFESSKISYSVGNSPIAEVNIDGLNSIDGLYFMTGKNAIDRDITISNLDIEYHGTLDDYKDILRDNIDMLLDSMDVDHNYIQTKDGINQAVSDAEAIIDSSDEFMDCYAAFENLLMTLVITPDDATLAIIEAKNQALSELEKYIDDNNYTFEMANVVYELQAGGYIVDKNYLITDLENQLDGVNSLDTIAEELAISKTQADNWSDTNPVMVGEYSDFMFTDIIDNVYPRDDYSESDADYSLCMMAYQNASRTNKDEVDAAIENLIDGILLLDTDEEKRSEAKSNAKAELASYKATEIAQEDANTQQLIAEIKTEGATSIDEQITIIQIEDMLDSLKASIDGLLVSLNQVISDYNTDITTKKNALLTKIDIIDEYRALVESINPNQVDSTTATTKALAKEQYDSIMAKLNLIDAKFDAYCEVKAAYDAKNELLEDIDAMQDYAASLQTCENTIIAITDINNVANVKEELITLLNGSYFDQANQIELNNRETIAINVQVAVSHKADFVDITNGLTKNTTISSDTVYGDIFHISAGTLKYNDKCWTSNKIATTITFNTVSSSAKLIINLKSKTDGRIITVDGVEYDHKNIGSNADFEINLTGTSHTMSFKADQESKVNYFEVIDYESNSTNGKLSGITAKFATSVENGAAASSLAYDIAGLVYYDSNKDSAIDNNDLSETISLDNNPNLNITVYDENNTKVTTITKTGNYKVVIRYNINKEKTKYNSYTSDLYLVQVVEAI